MEMQSELLLLNKNCSSVATTVYKDTITYKQFFKFLSNANEFVQIDHYNLRVFQFRMNQMRFLERRKLLAVLKKIDFSYAKFVNYRLRGLTKYFFLKKLDMCDSVPNFT